MYFVRVHCLENDSECSINLELVYKMNKSQNNDGYMIMYLYVLGSHNTYWKLLDDFKLDLAAYRLENRR